MTNFSKEQLDKIRAFLEKVGVKPECPACKKGMLVIDRGQFGLQEVTQLRETPTGAAGGTAGSTGRMRRMQNSSAETISRIATETRTRRQIRGRTVAMPSDHDHSIVSARIQPFWYLA